MLQHTQALPLVRPSAVSCDALHLAQVPHGADFQDTGTHKLDAPDAPFGTGAGDPMYAVPDHAFPAAEEGAGAGNTSVTYATGEDMRLSFKRHASTTSTASTASGANTYE